MYVVNIGLCFVCHLELDTSMIEHLLMVQCVVGLIPHGRPIELFIIPASALQLVYYSLLWCGSYKRSQAPNQKD